MKDNNKAKQNIFYLRPAQGRRSLSERKYEVGVDPLLLQVVEQLDGEVVVDVDRDLEVRPGAVPLGAAGGDVVGVDADRVGQIQPVRGHLHIIQYLHGLIHFEIDL